MLHLWGDYREIPIAGLINRCKLVLFFFSSSGVFRYPMDRLEVHTLKVVSLRQSLFVLGRRIQGSLKRVSSGVAPDGTARAEVTGLCLAGAYPASQANCATGEKLLWGLLLKQF